MAENIQEVKQFFAGNKEGFLSLLKSFVEMETPTHDPDSFTGIFQMITKEFEALHYQVEHIEGSETAGQLLCTPRGFDTDTASKQLIMGHCDTVWDKGTLKEMPFSIDQNRVSGPGVYDMKAGLCMMIFGLKAIKELGVNIPVVPVFLLSTDEETGSKESKSIILDWAKKSERTYVLEPALGLDGKIKTRRKGVGNFEITITGKPSHAGLAPEEGVSAILGLSHIVQKLFQLNEPSRGISVNVGTIEGGERSNVIAAKSKAVVDVRVPDHKTGERIKSEIYNLESDLKGIEIDVSGDIYRPPMEKNEENEKLWKITQKLGHGLGIELQEGISGGASDGNFTNLYSPTIDGLGAVGEGAHAWHEKIFLEETLQRAALFTLLLMQPSIK